MGLEILIISFLGFFKYYNFFLDNFINVFSFFWISILHVYDFYIGSYSFRNLNPNINYKLGGNTYNRLKEVKSVSNVQLLFLGSSHSYRGFDTRIFKENGVNTFNLGTTAQSPIQTQLLLKRYLDKLNPELIIFEVYPPTFSVDGVEPSLDVISNDKNDLYSLQMALNTNKIRLYNTLLYASIRDVFSLNENFKSPTKLGNDTYIKGGFVERELRYYKSEIFPEKKYF